MKLKYAFFRSLIMLLSLIGRVSCIRTTGLFLCFYLLFFNNLLFSQNEYPPSVAHIQTVKAGSLIIPMDTVNQRNPGYFNLKSYGLINVLLQNEIPVMWAIKAGKIRTIAGSVDFTATVNRVFPDTTFAGSITFRNGPFIIDSTWVAKALPVIAAFANNVVLFKLNNPTTIDIRYNLTFKPHLVLLNGGHYDTITVHLLTEAGFNAGSYFLQTTGTIFNPTSGYSLASDAHYAGGDTAHINPVMRFVNQYGGNLVADCAAIGAYENNANIMTTAGIDSFSTGIASTGYYNHDLPIAQFLGNLITPVGEYKFWNMKSGSTFKSASSYQVVRGSLSPFHYIVAGAKLRPVAEKGSNVFYLPGHDYYFYNNGNANDNNKINGRRIYLNAVFIPPNDAANLDFITDVKLNFVPQPGFAVKNENFVINVIASNVGHWRAKNLSVQVPLPVGLTYVSHVCSKGAFNNGTGIWSIDSLTTNEIDTLCLTVTIAQLGNIVYPGALLNQSLEYILPNNYDTLRLFGVSRPVANMDTMNFFSPLYQDINTKSNDTDEDGGPFGNAQIVAGPYFGTAQIINGDTIRYTLTTPGFSGTDSLLYVTCDQYPLCDSNWVLINVQFPLPITLLRFDGKRSNGKIDLHWVTLTEENNDYFSIERCSDNKSFESRGRVSGAGNSNVISEYNFSDTDNSAPFYYYRLRQFDFNGQSYLSPVIVLSQKMNHDLAVTLIPNPVAQNEQLTALLQGFYTGIARLQITDMAGRIIIKRELNITVSNQLAFLEMNDKIESGCYTVTVTTSYETFSVRLIVK